MDILSTISEVLVTPAIIAIGAALLVIIKSVADRVTKTISAKNEIAALESQAAIREKLIIMVDEAVKAAVAANMKTVEEMKKTNKKLTNDQIIQLNESAREIALNTLPPELTSSEGTLNQILGGSDKLSSMINAYMEKYVYEYKLIQPDITEIL